MMLKRNVPLPSFAPKSRQVGLSSDIATLEPGQSGVVPYNVNAVKQACRKYAVELAERSNEHIAFAVWPCTSDGSADETGKKFALVARLTEAQAETYEEQRSGSTIRVAA